MTKLFRIIKFHFFHKHLLITSKEPHVEETVAKFGSKENRAKHGGWQEANIENGSLEENAEKITKPLLSRLAYSEYVKLRHISQSVLGFLSSTN